MAKSDSSPLLHPLLFSKRIRLFSGLIPEVDQAKHLFSDLQLSKEDEKKDLSFTLILLEWEVSVDKSI